MPPERSARGTFGVRSRAAAPQAWFEESGSSLPEKINANHRRRFAGRLSNYFDVTRPALDRLELEVMAIGYEDRNENSNRTIEKFIETVGGQYDSTAKSDATQ